MPVQPTRVEYRVQRRSVGPDGQERWRDLVPLSPGDDLDEALAYVAAVPNRRLVKVTITETVEVVPGG